MRVRPGIKLLVDVSSYLLIVTAPNIILNYRHQPIDYHHLHVDLIRPYTYHLGAF